MRKEKINLGWTLQQGEPARIPMMPVQTRTVNLPHDFMIEGDVKADSKNGPNTGYYSGGAYTYTKQLDIPADWEGRRVLVYFDGVFGHTRVILNGHSVGAHCYGYTPFTVDLTSRLKYGGNNRLAVVVSNDDEPNSRWYSGGGIYRDVFLLTAPMVHFAPDALFLHTDHILNGDAFVIAEATVENHTAADFCGWVDFSVKDSAGRGKIRAYVPAGQTKTCRTQLCIEDARLWDIDSPNLYEVNAALLDENGDAMDGADTAFGIRTISVDSRNGFVLNGRTVKLKGGCLHHDNGILGAASFYDAEYRKLKKHKDNGYNAIRCAHNPASSAFLDACDHLGLLVMEEAFDTWNMPKNLHDFTEHFDAQWQQELERFLRRDRNHPSIVMWSIGNELPEQGGLSAGYRVCAQLSEFVRELDATRPVCGALCSFFSGLDDDDTQAFWKSLMEDAGALGGGGISNLDSRFGKAIWNDRTEPFAAPWDVVGYNYLAYHYEEAGELFPNRVICCTESKPREMLEYWRAVEKYPYLIGDFAWTSQDYIGEAGIGKVVYTEPENAASAAQQLHSAAYPWRTAGTGDFDLLGWEKPQLAYRRILWGSKETYLAVHDPRNHGKAELLGRYGWPDCANSWNWPVEQGHPVTVTVYSAAPEVELLQNGKHIGRLQTAAHMAVFETEYLPGELTAISYDGQREISRDTLRSGGDVAALRIRAEKTTLPAGGEALCFAELALVDADGQLVPYAEPTLTAEAEGAAVLLAFGSARPQTAENYTSGCVKAYRGRAMAVIRAKPEAGTATLTVKAAGLPDAVLTIQVI